MSWLSEFVREGLRRLFPPRSEGPIPFSNGLDPDHSVVDLLKSQRRPSDFEARRRLANEYGRSYSGTAEENEWLMREIRRRS